MLWASCISLLRLMVIETIELGVFLLSRHPRCISLLWLMVIETSLSPLPTIWTYSYISLLWLMVIETHLAFGAMGSYPPVTSAFHG